MSKSELKEPVGIAACLFFVAVVFLTGPAAADWPEPAERSGTTLPEIRTISALVEAGGIYVRQVEGLSNDSTGIFEGMLTWNLRLIGNLGLFGEHAISKMWWDNISILAFGHEVGIRFLFGPYLVFEAAYLGHRVEYEWVDDSLWSVGGVYDHGAEVGIWGHFEPFSRLRLEGHLLGRKFAEPADEDSYSYTDQIVFGLGLRAHFMPVDRHAVVIELETLRVYRGTKRRPGVEATTWNTLGSVFWRSSLTDRFGIQLGARVSTNWLCGEVPMLEIKRSMINEPMAKILVGFYFLI
ncbi:MAG: hypothetical protein GY847_41810 [Proteobacteria bacterium]|nr:hypothetical protein [Pseudomonadota bacterium]